MTGFYSTRKGIHQPLYDLDFENNAEFLITIPRKVEHLSNCIFTFINNYIDLTKDASKANINAAQTHAKITMLVTN